MNLVLQKPAPYGAIIHANDGHGRPLCHFENPRKRRDTGKVFGFKPMRDTDDPVTCLRCLKDMKVAEKRGIAAHSKVAEQGAS